MNKFRISLICVALCGHAWAATDQAAPYIGTQTADGTGNDALNNGAIQTDVAAWGTDVTSEVGTTFGYITPENDSSHGGVWAGDKAAAVTFGGADTGLFVDGGGAKVKNTDLDLTGNTIKNVQDGVNGKDAVNVSQLQGSAQETLSAANTYTDGKAKETLSTANTYTDGKAMETLSSANTYTDGKAKETLSTANTYTDGKSQETLGAANAHSDARAQETLSSANHYADQRSGQMLGAANAYTDQRVDRLEKKVNRGLASTAALSGLFQPYGVGKFNLSAGMGGYRGESAIALGTGYRFNENVAAKAGISTTVGDSSSAMYNASVNFEW